MLLPCALLLLPNAVSLALALPASQQSVLGAIERIDVESSVGSGSWNDDEGVGHFSEWSRNSKVAFIEEIGRASCRERVS